MNKRVVIFATTYFPLVGGAEIAMKEITDRLPGWGFDLVCAKIRPDLAESERIGNVTVHRCGFGSANDKYLLPVLGVWRALRLGKRRDIGCIWSLMASYGGFAALVYAWLRPGTKLLLTLQEGDPLEHYAKRVGKLGFLHRKIFQRADAVHAISRFLADWATKMGFKGKPEVVPNGVDIAKFTRSISPDKRTELREGFGFTEDDVVLVTASRLSLKNGVDDLIRALSYLPSNHKVLIAGEGEDADKLRVLVEQKGLKERVVFLGKRSHDELPGILQSADVFVRASLSEGLGNSFLEAMASGLPIVGTPVGGIPDFLRDGETGVFCKPRNPESIARAVEFLTSEKDMHDRIIRNGLALVKERYSWVTIAESIEKQLLRLLES
ncbi:MAG: glycosyltransferase family 4 protein [Patescibacteria group bacterium]|nr:glycosyltransferase family 4 protein [Patescibacteria group bacterium]